MSNPHVEDERACALRIRAAVSRLIYGPAAPETAEAERDEAAYALRTRRAANGSIH